MKKILAPVLKCLSNIGIFFLVLWDIFKIFYIPLIVIAICVWSITSYIVHRNDIRYDRFYYNEKFVLVETNESAGETQDKFHEPIYVKKWLIRSIKDTTLFRELSNHDNSYNTFIITNELWYNKKKGDTLYFKYLLKDNFFRISR